MSQYIKNLVQTKGFKEIEDMFLQECYRCSDLSDLPSNASDEVVAREARVRGETSKRIKALMVRIKLAGSTNDKKEISYK